MVRVVQVRKPSIIQAFPHELVCLAAAKESDAANSAVVSVRTPSPNNQGINLHSFSPSRIQNLLRACIKLTGVFPTATPYLLAALTSTLL
jgi:hypothetical protein